MNNDINRYLVLLLIIIPIIQTLLTPVWRGLSDSLATLLYIIFLIASSKSFWKRSYLLFIIGSLIGFLFEFIGLHYGVIFGSYEYLGFRHLLILDVPLPIIFAWGIYITYSYLMAYYLFDRLRWLYSSLILLILDLAIDPIMVSNNIWIWHGSTPAAWYGIPFTNYIGWFIVSSLSVIIYESLDANISLKEYGFLTIIAVYSLYLPLIIIASHEVYYPIIYSIILLTLFTLLSILNRNRRRIMSPNIIKRGNYTYFLGDEY